VRDLARFFLDADSCSLLVGYRNSGGRRQRGLPRGCNRAAKLRGCSRGATADPHRYGIHRHVNKSQRKQGALGRIERVGGASTVRSASRRASGASQHAVLNGLFEPVMAIVSTPPWVSPQCPLLARGRGCPRSFAARLQPRGSRGVAGDPHCYGIQREVNKSQSRTRDAIGRFG